MDPQIPNPRLSLQFKIVQIFLWVGAGIFFLWILNKNIVPSGKLVIEYNASQRSSFINNFASKEKDRLIGTKNSRNDTDAFQLITTTPLYFDLRVPRPFAKAEVSLLYQNPDDQPMIQLGTLHNPYVLQNMANLNPLLENLPEEWEKIRDGDIVLWQKNNEWIKAKRQLDDEKRVRAKQLQKDEESALEEVKKQYETKILSSEAYEQEKSSIQEQYAAQLKEVDAQYQITERPQLRYSTVGEFLQNPPEPREILQYDYYIDRGYVLPGYQPQTGTVTIDKSLRGPHEIVTYISEGEELSFRFRIQDINRHAGKDDFRVEIWAGGKMFYAKEIKKMGTILASGESSPEEEFEVVKQGLRAGEYHVKIETVDDVFIKQIQTKQHLFLFANNLYLAENKEYQSVLKDKVFAPTTVYTTSSEIDVLTAHENGFQNLRVNNTILPIKSLQTKEDVSGLKGVTTIVSPENDIQLHGDGYFAFSEDQIFEPEQESVTFTSTKDLSKYDYIIARYPEIKKEGDWSVATASLVAPDLSFNKNEAHLYITLPGLPENNRVLKVKGLRITLTKPPLTFSGAVHKLIEKTKKLF